ncbi:CDP-2,3-bis-(O-geranylgeranyl)-sn-glycerol synthase [Thermoproteus tenax]|uniref:CDP-archaeol synthase n=1 Tax=Thermoproteus tenax (strain ATCC 35583 / DSM 2078 / JCM 9277 / NBRC 100435 / Kra 1) TaxID=768679 RepID=G4RL59_THETK|nr:CDP-2,3-bis-(O-geranylgeranyl)-sn-glycerol synthase [Thermoproteus tenax]CCC82304.1 CDP-diglyceride synthetase [Thermoproteus tenax Kra 1]
MIDQLIFALVLIWPSYVANGLAVLAALIPRRHPVDFGKMWRGRRILGDGKTFEGLLIGTLFGSTLGWLPNLLVHMLTPLDAFMLAVSALVGDILGAFIKRRLCLPRGYPAFPLDQLDFLLMSLLVYSLYKDISILTIILSIIITPIIHRLTNILAYIAKLKKEPW